MDNEKSPLEAIEDAIVAAVDKGGLGSLSIDDLLRIRTIVRRVGSKQAGHVVPDGHILVPQLSDLHMEDAGREALARGGDVGAVYRAMIAAGPAISVLPEIDVREESFREGFEIGRADAISGGVFTAQQVASRHVFKR